MIKLSSGRLRTLIREEIQAASSSVAWREAIDNLGSALTAVQVLESESGRSPLGRSTMKMIHDLHLAVTKMEGF